MEGRLLERAVCREREKGAQWAGVPEETSYRSEEGRVFLGDQSWMYSKVEL